MAHFGPIARPLGRLAARPLAWPPSCLSARPAGWSGGWPLCRPFGHPPARLAVRSAAPVDAHLVSRPLARPPARPPGRDFGLGQLRCATEPELQEEHSCLSFWLRTQKYVMVINYGHHPHPHLLPGAWFYSLEYGGVEPRRPAPKREPAGTAAHDDGSTRPHTHIEPQI